MTQKIQFNKLSLDGFGCFGPEQREFTFAPSAVNVVIGPNESGKTTLVRAIFSLIFGIYNHELRLLSRPWSERAPYGGALTLSLDDVTYRFRHDFAQCLATVEELDEHGETCQTLYDGLIGKRATRPEAALYREAIQELLGAASPSFLLNSTFVRQAQTGVDLGSEVQRIIAGVRRGDLKRIRQRLDEQYTNLTDYNRFTKGHLKDRAIERVEKRMTERRERLERASEDAQQHERLMREACRIEEELSECAATQEKTRKRLQELERLHEHLKNKTAKLEKLTELRAEEERRQNQEEEIRQIAQECEKQYPELLEAPANLEAQLQELSPLQSRIQVLGEQQQRALEANDDRLRQIEGLEQALNQEYPALIALGDDFPARLEQHRKLLEQLEEVDERTEGIDEQLDELEQQLQEYGVLAELDSSFEDEWLTAHDKFSRQQKMKDDFKHHHERAQHKQRQKKKLSLFIFILCIVLGIGSFSLLLQIRLLFACIALFVLLATGVGAMVVMRSSKPQFFDLRRRDMQKTITQLEKELRILRRKWGDDEIDLETVKDLDRFREAQELRRQRQTLWDKRGELKESADRENSAENEDSDRAVKPRRSQLEAELSEFVPVFDTLKDEPLETVLELWGMYKEKCDELERLKTLAGEFKLEDMDELEELRRQHNLLYDQLAPFLTEEDLAETQSRLQAFRKLVQEAQIRQEQLQQERAAKEVQDERAEQELEFNRLADSIDEILRDYPGLRPLVEQPAELSDKMLECSETGTQLVEQIEDLRQQFYQCRSEAAALPFAGDEELELLKEQIEDDQRELEQLRRHCRALEIAIETLEECEHDFQMIHMDRLGKITEQYFAELTNNKYHGVAFSKEYEPVVSSSTNSSISAHQLSHGARDQLDLAIRFALARELANDVCWPFLFDDPFVNCDEQRRERLRQTLQQLAQRHQIIFFTHDNFYADWGEINRLQEIAPTAAQSE